MSEPQKWVVIWGNATVEAGAIEHVPTRTFVPPPPSAAGDAQQQQPQQVAPPHTVIRSSLEFEQGTVSWDVWLDESTASCFVMLPADPAASPAMPKPTDPATGGAGDVDFVAGLNCLGAPYGLATLRNGQWEALGGSGVGTLPPAGRWVSLAVKVAGSSIDLFVDGVRVATTRQVLKKGQVGLFMQSYQAVKVRNFSVAKELPLCFAIMQFTKEFGDLYEEVIRPQCEQFGYRVVRADEFYTSGQILDDIRQSIESASLIIADVTPDNANVYYELGYAHGIGKQTILMCDRGRQKLPFDISGFRTVFYDNTIGGKRSVETRLRQFLAAIQER